MLISVKNVFTKCRKIAKNMIKLGCDKSGDSKILLVENKFLYSLSNMLYCSQ